MLASLFVDAFSRTLASLVSGFNSATYGLA